MSEQTQEAPPQHDLALEHKRVHLDALRVAAQGGGLQESLKEEKDAIFIFQGFVFACVVLTGFTGDHGCPFWSSG